MNQRAGGAVVELERIYQQRDHDPEFAAILGHCGDLDDDGLAELIEHDGRLRIEHGLDVSLDRYLAALPNLSQRPDALDAAIDMALRSIAGSGHPDLASMETLIERYPALETPIREAGILGNAIWSTMRIRDNLAARPAMRALPAAFGQVMPDGRHRYELRRLLGEGAFGQVYLAADRQLSEDGHEALVAIKVLNTRERGPWLRQRLADEATKARRIDHAQVVRVLDLGVSDQDEDFIVYEYVDGGDLSRSMRRRRDTMPIADAVDLVIRVARGVHAAHMAGLVHCDLKPANIMLSTRGEPKVADFGIAIRAAEAIPNPDAGEEQRPLGNLAFISPEQFRMEPGALTVPSDLYALGGLLYWLITGILPNGESATAIQAAHDPVSGRRRPPSMRDANRRVDQDLDAIGLRAMALEPFDRFASAAEFADDLEAWSRREAIPWTAPSSARRLILWSRRKPGLAAAGALIAVLAVSVLAVLLNLSRVSREREVESIRAEVAQTQLELKEASMLRAKAIAQSFRAQMKHLGENGIRHELLPQIWIMEWMFGPNVLGEDADELGLWPNRIDVVRLLLDDLRARGEDRTLEAQVWESSLAFWLVSGGEFEESEPLLARNRASWAALLPAGDPWHADLEALERCAVAARLASGGAVDPTELAETVRALDEAEPRLAARAVGTPLHLLVLASLAKLHGPELLDDPDRVVALERAHYDAMERISVVTKELKEEAAREKERRLGE